MEKNIEFNNINNDNIYNNTINNQIKIPKKKKMKRKRKIKKTIQVEDNNKNKNIINNEIINNDKEVNFNQNIQPKDLNNKKEFLKSYNDKEMNSFEYEDALKIDKRSYIQYYISLLRTQHILLFTFLNFKDDNSQIIKIFIFFFSFAINYTISAMFYSDETMHKIYIDAGSFDFTYQLPQMVYSFIISSILQVLLNYLGLYEDNIITIKKNIKNKEIKKNELFKIKLKLLIFFVITYILLFLCWIYLGCFCAVYKNTQIHLLLDVSSSFAISFIWPFIFFLLPTFFRIISLKNNKRYLMFKFSKLLELISI